MKFKCIILLIILLTNRFESKGTLYTVTNLSGLTPALANAVNPGDVIYITVDLDVSSLTLPLEVQSGVTVMGNYDLLSEPNSQGSTSPNGTLISSTKRVDYSTVGGNNGAYFVFKLLPGTLTNPTTIKNIRLKGPSWNWIDYNNHKVAGTNFMSGGIFLDYNGSNSYFNVSHNEVFGFSFAGVFGSRGSTNIHIDHCYIHNIKGFCDPGIGYGNWYQGNSVNSDVYIENNIYDDCKTAIDGNSGILNWYINNCTMTQFFYGGIGKHAGNIGFLHEPNVPLLGSSSCDIYYTSASSPITSYFNVYDVAGGNSILNQNISHFKLAESGGRGGLCGFPYPYTFSFYESSNAYTPIVSPITTLVDNGTTPSIYPLFGTLNDGGWANIPIGFTFNFFDNAYQTCNISTNGFLQFGTFDFQIFETGTPNTYGAPNNLIALSSTDLDFNSAQNYSRKIKFSQSVLNGSQIFEVEWENVDNNSTPVMGTLIGKIRLVQGSNEIEIHIGTQNLLLVSPPVLGIESAGGNGLILKNGNTWNETNHIYRFGSPQRFTVSLSGNTLNSPQGGPDAYVTTPTNIRNRGGYATIADNYIESCTWNEDPQIKFNQLSGAANDNSFDYSPGIIVGSGCPQPPECNISLKDIANVVLPKTNINSQYTPNGYSYLPSGSPIMVSLNPGALGSQNNCYIVRPNPNNGSAIANNSSANNNFFDGTQTLGPATGNVSHTFSLYDLTKPGLYGIDALAISANNSANPLWNQYNSSSWQHTPFISIPSYGDPHLIFNIKDSYYEQYTPPGTTPYPNTGVVKTVELNGHRIWEEDIAVGGDGWERVDIPLYNNPDILPEWILPSAEGKNLLSFSINFSSSVSPANPVSASTVQGVSVWIDDVYINRFDNAKGTNLIIDGDMENENCGTLPTTGQQCQGVSCLESCSWFINDKNSTGYPVMCWTSSTANSEQYYNDGNPLFRSSTQTVRPYWCDAYLSGRDRKSGQTSIVLNLPKLDLTDCANYLCPNVEGPPPSSELPINPFVSGQEFIPGLVSAFTQFEYPHCGSYEKDLEDKFTAMPLTEVYGIIPPDNYNLNKSLTIAAGAILQFDNSTIAIGPGVTITVPFSSTLKINATNLSACSDMWNGIINNGGNVIIQNGSEIKDAISALTVNSGTFQINGSTFDHNYQGVTIHSGVYDPASNWVYDSHFKCTNGEITKAPYFGKLTAYHLFLEKVDNFKLGDNSQGVNHFENANNAVRSYNTNLLLENNDFTFVGYTGKNNGKTIAVNAWTDFFAPNFPNPTPTFSLQILGVAGTSTINSFNGWDTGVKTDQVSNVLFENNSIFDCRNGIYATRGRKLTASNNIIYRFNQGIYCFDFWQLETGLKQYEKSIYIIDNIFNEAGVYNSDSYGKVAINIQNGLGHIMHSWVENNLIHNSLLGIHLRSVSWSRIVGNRYEAFIPNSSISDNHFGIHVEDSPYADVNANTVERMIDAGDVTGHTSTSSESDLMRGISLDNSPNSTVTNNTSINMGSDIRVYGGCIGSEIRCNNMHSSFRGINLVSATIVGGTSYGSINDATGNTWNGEYLNNANMRIDGTWNIASQVDWWHEGSVVAANAFCPYYHSAAILPKANASSSGCPFINPYRMDEKDKEYIKKTALDILNYGNFEVESKLKDDDYSYQAAKLDPDLLIDPTPAAVLIDQWYQAMKLGNPGKYNDAKEFVAAHNKQAAQIAAFSIVDSNLVLQNQKQTMEIYLNHFFERDSVETDSTTLATLYSIATQNAMQGGTGVYNARAMLNLDVQDYLQIGLRTRRNIRPEDTHENHFMISPNPANTKCTLTFYKPGIKKITISDLLGKSLQFYCVAFDENQFEIDLSKLNSGSYSITVVYDSMVRENEILTVVH